MAKREKQEKGQEMDEYLRKKSESSIIRNSPASKNRSVFELTESGAHKVVFDSLQYYLDGLFLVKSTNLRVKCACKLIEICTSTKQVLLIFRNNGIANTLLRVVGLLSSERDHSLRLCLQVLALLLCQSEKGDIPYGFFIPHNVFVSLLSSILYQPSVISKPATTTNNDNNNIIVSSSSSNNISTKTSQAAQNDSMDSSSNIHRKRKFTAKKGGAIINNEGDTDINKKQSALDNDLDTDPSGYFTNKATGNATSNSILEPEEIIKQLLHLRPSLFHFFGFEYILKPGEMPEVGKLLSLTVISRYMASIVYHDSQVQGQGQGKLRSGDDRNNSNSSNNNDNNSQERRNDEHEQVETNRLSTANSNALLLEYQSLLRCELKCELFDQKIGSSLSYSSNSSSSSSSNCESVNDDNKTEIFLETIVSDISVEMIAAIEVLEKKTSILIAENQGKGKKGKAKREEGNIFNNNNDVDRDYLHLMGIPRINRIFQVLCLLEAACFRCPENQVNGS